MGERKGRLLVAILLITTGPALFLQSIHITPPIHSYESKEITGGIEEQEMELFGESVQTYENLSDGGGILFRDSLNQSNNRTEVRSSIPSLSSTSYVKYGSKFYKIEVENGDSKTSLKVKRVSVRDVLDDSSVSVTAFRSRAYFGLRITETHRQVVKKTIKHGEYKSMTYVGVDRVVQHDGSYYKIHRHSTGYIERLLLLVMVFGSTLGIIFPILGAYIVYESAL